ncbi:MAG: DNA gyrase subunit A [Chloroflexi bacterium]|nr:DNA gyrase subunit A [Chloroflexota bacterium]
MEVGLVQKIDIDNEMQQAYLDYAMSVIIARALPDARDGLKPVHRRILYAMYDMGLRPDSAYKKSARIVGEVLGKYHPHGDQAVYEAMARMAQDFSMRCLLVDGQGNFGSVDGDPPAAMRYTEARLATPAMELLADIQKETVDFVPNFDGSLEEPTVLPSAIPNLLVNGATGIAVGMSTSIPPHNLGEVVDALIYMLEHWEKMDDITIEDMMQFIQEPDFPTGGVILPGSGEETLTSAYGSGRGKVTVQALAHLEEMERGRNRIIVTELPYMTNKASLIERIAELVREGKLEGIADLRDESDRQGMRIVIELARTADPETALRELYRHTPMQSNFSIILLALVDGEPRLLSLKQALRVYLDHRLEIIRRRREYDLERARQRAHILEGLRVALQNLDEVISLIRKAPDVETARQRLMKRFRLSESQAQAILDMQLRRLAALERKKIEDEYKELQLKIKELVALLRSAKKMRQVVADELQVVKETYGERRRTQIVKTKTGGQRALLTTGDLAEEKTVWLAVSREGLICRSLENKPPRQSGNEAPGWLAQTSTRHILYLVCADGKAAAVPVHAIPEAETPSEGILLHKVSPLQPEDQLAALFNLPPKGERPESGFVLSATRQGMLKKSALTELPGPSANVFTLAKVPDGDQLAWVRLTDGAAEVLLLTANGMAIRFNENEVRPMGLVSAGVLGMKLKEDDQIAGMETLPKAGDVFMIASDGNAKRVALDQFPRQGRYGQGVAAWKLSGKVKITGMMVGANSAHLTVFTDRLAPKLVQLDEAPLQGRSARGKILPALKGCRVVGISAVANGEQKPSPSGGKKRQKVTPHETIRSSVESIETEISSSATQLSMNHLLREVNGKLRSSKSTSQKQPAASQKSKKAARAAEKSEVPGKTRAGKKAAASPTARSTTRRTEKTPSAKSAPDKPSAVKKSKTGSVPNNKSTKTVAVITKESAEKRIKTAAKAQKTGTQPVKNASSAKPASRKINAGKITLSKESKTSSPNSAKTTTPKTGRSTRSKPAAKSRVKTPPNTISKPRAKKTGSKPASSTK